MATCGAALAGFLIKYILEIGLDPTELPPLLSPIDQDEIELLCWMGIEPEGFNLRIRYINQAKNRRRKHERRITLSNLEYTSFCKISY